MGGGSGADFTSYVLATKELAYGDAGVCNIVSATNSYCVKVLDHGTPEQKERFLRPVASGREIACMMITEPQAGSDAVILRTRAVQTGGGYVLNGTKTLITAGQSADVAVVLACLTGAPLCEKYPQTAQAVNFDAVKMLAVNLSPSQQLIFPNTNSGYGVGANDLYCDEDSPLNPISLYGSLKVELERYLLDKGHCVTFRFATVFGVSPRMRLDLLVNDFTCRAVRDRVVVLFEADFKRNFLHVRDAARAFDFAMELYDDLKGRPYNVGLSDANLSKRELCEALQKLVPEFRYLISEFGKDVDQRNYIVSNARIESAGYATTVTLEQGIQELIKGYQIIRQGEFSNI